MHTIDRWNFIKKKLPRKGSLLSVWRGKIFGNRSGKNPTRGVSNGKTKGGDSSRRCVRAIDTNPPPIRIDPLESYTAAFVFYPPLRPSTRTRGGTRLLTSPFFQLEGGGKAATVTHFLWRNNAIVVRKFAVLRTSHVPLSALIDSRALRGNPPLFSSFFCFSFLFLSLSFFFFWQAFDRPRLIPTLISSKWKGFEGGEKSWLYVINLVSRHFGSFDEVFFFSSSSFWYSVDACIFIEYYYWHETLLSPTIFSFEIIDRMKKRRRRK